MPTQAMTLPISGFFFWFSKQEEKVTPKLIREVSIIIMIKLSIDHHHWSSLLVDEDRRSLISSFCSFTRNCTLQYCYLCLLGLVANHLLSSEMPHADYQ